MRMLPMAWALRKWPFSSPGLPTVPMLHPGDLAGDDLAAAQGDAFAGVAVADGVAQPRKHPCGIVHKGHGAYPGRGIPHPHPGAPLPGSGCPTQGSEWSALLTAADIDDLHGACGRFQSFLHGIVGLGQAVCPMRITRSPSRSPLPLGGVCGAAGAVRYRKSPQ